MAFLDVRLPVKISLGTSSGPFFQTDVITYGNGQEYRNSRWLYQKTRFDVSYVVKNRADAIEVYNFFLLAKGRFNSFRVKDNLDFTSNSDGVTTRTPLDQNIGVGTGSQTQFQLVKAYSNGVASYSRKITKPVTGTVQVAINSVTTTAFTVNTTTGIITFNTPPAAAAVLTAGYEYDIHARFDQDSLEGIQYILLRQNGANDRFTFPSLEVVEVL